MIVLLFILACGEDPAENDKTSKADRQQRREERKRIRDEKYQVVMDDLEQTKTDMHCIREFVTVQQQIPDEKMDYDLFEKAQCEKIELVR
tara:strand:- start:220 stop:489 length:270 start_codon:yes stop_codon:yes gene_type:complete